MTSDPCKHTSCVFVIICVHTHTHTSSCNNPDTSHIDMSITLRACVCVPLLCKMTTYILLRAFVSSRHKGQGSLTHTQPDKCVCACVRIFNTDQRATHEMRNDLNLIPH